MWVSIYSLTLLLAFYLRTSNNYCIFLLITAECSYQSHVVAGATTNVKGGGGQRKVQAENPQPCTSPSFTPLSPFSGGDPCVCSTFFFLSSHACIWRLHWCIPFVLQVFPPRVPHRGWGPVGETPGLWQHAAPSRQRWMLAGCYDQTRSKRVNEHLSNIRTTSRRNSPHLVKMFFYFWL